MMHCDVVHLSCYSAVYCAAMMRCDVIRVAMPQIPGGSRYYFLYAESDPGVGAFGLHNGLIQLGDCFLEVVAPLPEKHEPLNQTAGGRYISRFGDGGYMVLMQVPSLAMCEGVLVKDRNLKIIHGGGRSVGEGQHPYPDRRHTPLDPVPEEGITGTHLHPKDMGCIIEVTECNPKEEWLWAGANWRSASPHGTSKISGAFAGVEIAVPDPAAVSERWEAGMGLKRIDGTNHLVRSDRIESMEVQNACTNY